MKRLMYTDLDSCTSVGLLLLRVVMGIAFVLHGWGKIQSPFAWMPAEVPIPGILQAAAAASEFGGGIALLLGVLTRVAAFFLAITMLVAAAFHIMNGDPFAATGPGQASWEPAAVYLACSVLFVMSGAGRFSLDAVLFGNRELPPPV